MEKAKCTDVAVYATADGSRVKRVPLPADVPSRARIEHKGATLDLVARIITAQDALVFDLFVEACRIKREAGESMPQFPNRRRSDRAAA